MQFTHESHVYYVYSHIVYAVETDNFHCWHLNNLHGYVSFSSHFYARASIDWEHIVLPVSVCLFVFLSVRLSKT